LLKLSFVVLYICKKHIIKLRINIWPSQVYLSLGIIQNISKKFQKIQKKSSDFFKIKILLGNSFASFPKMLKILKNSNFFTKIFDKTADCKKIAIAYSNQLFSADPRVKLVIVSSADLFFVYPIYNSGECKSFFGVCRLHKGLHLPCHYHPGSRRHR
jgi:hypothetical protein